MQFDTVIDWPSAVVVLGGTAVAGLLRSGRAEMLACVQLLTGLGRSGFCLRKERRRLAPDVVVVQRSGIYCAHWPGQKDGDLKAALDALVRCRSLAALTAAHRHSRSQRMEQREKGLRLLYQASDLAPVFGLAGTLIALRQPADMGAAASGISTAVAAAVLTTLYGLLLAHVVLLPLARMLERRGDREEAARQQLIDWLLEQLRDAVPEEASHARPATPQKADWERAA